MPPPTLTEEDLDNLDDVLDQFNLTSGNKPTANVTTSPPPPPPPPTATTSSFVGGRPRTNTRVDKPPRSIPGSGLPTSNEEDEDALDENALTAEFAKELAKGMENLVKELAEESGGSEDDKEKQLKAWEKMLIEEMNKMSNDTGEEEESKDYHKKIQETMDRLKENEEAFKSSSDTQNPDSLKDLLSLLKDADLDKEGLGESDEEMAAMLEGMMGTLMSKEILYEPLKELADKFPEYLQNPSSALSSEDRTRYESQLICVRKLTVIFDDPSYDENNPDTTKKVVELMTEMQSYGNPPQEVTGPMPDFPEGCVVV